MASGVGAGSAALLERQAAFNRAIIDSEIDGIAACHAIDEPPYMAFSVWNPAMEELTGYSMEEINRLGWYQTVYVDPAIQEMARLRMDRMRQGDHLRAEEWTITRKDGGKRTVQITTSTIIDRAGCPSVLAMMHDTLTCGDLVVYAFEGEAARTNYPGLKDQPFFKRIAGVAGDTVTVADREIFINGVSVGRAKTHAFDRRPLEPIEATVIPPGFLYDAFTQEVWNETEFELQLPEIGRAHV